MYSEKNNRNMSFSYDNFHSIDSIILYLHPFIDAPFLGK